MLFSYSQGRQPKGPDHWNNIVKCSECTCQWRFVPQSLNEMRWCLACRMTLKKSNYAAGVEKRIGRYLLAPHSPNLAPGGFLFLFPCTKKMPKKMQFSDAEEAKKKRRRKTNFRVKSTLNGIDVILRAVFKTLLSKSKFSSLLSPSSQRIVFHFP